MRRGVLIGAVGVTLAASSLAAAYLTGVFPWGDTRNDAPGDATAVYVEKEGEPDSSEYRGPDEQGICDTIDPGLLTRAVVGGSSGRTIEEEYIPADLVLLDDAVPGVSLLWKDQFISEAAAPYINAWVDHLRDERGIYLRLAHGYRDWEAQRATGKYGAAPGHSQHQLGTTFDVYKWYDWRGEHTPCTIPGNSQCEPFLDIIEDGLQYGIVHPIPDDYPHFSVVGMFGEDLMKDVSEMDYLDDGYYDRVNGRIAEVQESCGIETED